MISMLLLNNFKLMSSRIKNIIERELSFMDLCVDRSDFETGFIERNGNLSKLVLGSVMYGSGKFRTEYLILLMPCFTGGRISFKLELYFIAYDAEIIKSYREYNGYYFKQKDFEVRNNVFDDIVDLIKLKTENEIPLNI